jgi:hypothetical protein
MADWKANWIARKTTIRAIPNKIFLHSWSAKCDLGTDNEEEDLDLHVE